MNYTRLVPDDSFVGHYLRHNADTETATAYDFWCALWLVSLACGRNIFVDRPRAPVFLNLYTILVAESGITRKSTAVRQVSKIAGAFLDDMPLIGLVENKITPEKLDFTLHTRHVEAGCSQIAITVSELAIFLGIERYSSGMPALLTDLYDCPASRIGGGTLIRGGLIQQDVWVNFLSASTPKWLHRSVHPDVVEGGFTSRCIFVVASEPKARIAWPTPKTDAPPFTEWMKDIRWQARKNKTITLSESAIRAFTQWYRTRALHTDDFRSSFESREDAHVLRTAALLCVNDKTWIVQRQHVLSAIKLVIENKELASVLFSGTGTRGKWIMGIEAVRDALLIAGTDPMPRSNLYRLVRRNLTVQEFTALIDTMHESGVIKRFEHKTTGPGRPTDLIVATDLIRANGLVERLASSR